MYKNNLNFATKPINKKKNLIKIRWLFFVSSLHAMKAARSHALSAESNFKIGNKKKFPHFDVFRSTPCIIHCNIFLYIIGQVGDSFERNISRAINFRLAKQCQSILNRSVKIAAFIQSHSGWRVICDRFRWSKYVYY